MLNRRILIVCPDAGGLALLASMLKSLGHEIDEAPNDRAALRSLEREAADLVLACVDPGDSDCLELLAYLRRRHPAAATVLMFPRPHPERFKEAVQKGASAVLRYPAPAAELRAAVLQALEQAATRRAMVVPAEHPVESRHPAFVAEPAAVAEPRPEPAPAALEPEAAASRESALIGADPALRQILGLAGMLASSSATVLIKGESGTGKSELARRLHQGAAGTDRPFVTIHGNDFGDVAEGDDSTPPRRDVGQEWRASLARAAGGTLYVKEVGALGAALQTQLLQEIQIQDMEAASGRGGSSRRPARLVLSTSEDLAVAVEQGRFRQNLFHRVSAVCLTAPPLRLRGDDVETLAEHFRNQFAREFGRPVAGFTRDALDVLRRHEWPGNVRELQGIVQRAVVLCYGPRITATHLGPILNPRHGGRAAVAVANRSHLVSAVRPLKEALEEPEKQIIVQALQALGWNRQETARVLDINRTTLYKKMKKYGLLVDEPMWVE